MDKPYTGSRPYEPPKDLIQLGLPYGVSSKVGNLRTRPPNILLVDMFDPGEPRDEYVLNANDMLRLIIRKSLRVVGYSDMQPGVAEREGAELIVVSGKYFNFTDFMPGGRFHSQGQKFEDRFGPLVEIIKGTKIPLLLLCAGHQLYGMAYCGNDKLKDLDDLSNDEKPKKNIEGLFGIMQVHARVHPLFDEFAELPKGESDISPPLHYCHSQYLALHPAVDDRAPGVMEAGELRALAWHGLPREIFAGYNPKLIPTILEHVDLKNPGKHAFSFQCHPEWIAAKTDQQEKNLGGLVLLVNALSLLTNRDLSKNIDPYRDEKVRLYGPTGRPISPE